MVHPGGAETYYHHDRWPRPKPLPRLHVLLVNAVAWNCQSITEASTKEVILGTESGQIFKMAVNEADKREKYMKLFFELTELREGIKDLQMETTVVGSATRFYVMAVTLMRLYSFTSIGSLETVFVSYSDRAIHFMELPGEIPNRFCKMETLRDLALPPIFGFHSKDAELISHYLKKKISGQNIEFDVIPRVDIYKHELWDLPAKCNLPIQDNKWHFFASRDRKCPN